MSSQSSQHWLVTVLASSAVASVITVAGNYWLLESQKVRLAIVGKIIEQKIAALDSIKTSMDLWDSQLRVVQITHNASKATKNAVSEDNIKKYISEVANTQANISQAILRMPEASESRKKIRELLVQISPLLGEARNDVKKTDAVVRFYDNTFRDAAIQAKKSLDVEIDRLWTTLSPIEGVGSEQGLVLGIKGDALGLAGVLVAVLVGVMTSLLATLYYDRATSPRVEIVADESPRVEGQRPAHPRHQFLQVKARQVEARWPFCTRRPAWNCRVLIDVFRPDGERAIDGTVIARWSGSVQPFQTQVADGKPVEVPDSSLVPLGQRFVVYAKSEEQIGIAVKYEGQPECWLFSNESYFYDWTRPEWRLGFGKYFLMLRVEYETSTGESQWLLLENLGTDFAQWSVTLVAKPEFKSLQSQTVLG